MSSIYEFDDYNHMSTEEAIGSLLGLLIPLIGIIYCIATVD